MRFELEDLQQPIEYLQKTTSIQPGGEEFVDTSLEIKPITQKDIADLPFTERIEAVSKIQVDYWRPLLKEKYPELYEGGRKESIELAESLFDVRFRDKELVYYTERASQARASYKAQTESIKGLQKGERSKRAEELRTSFKSKEAELYEEKQAILKLRNTSLDLFINRTILSSSGIEDLQISAADLVMNTGFTEEEVSDLINKASSHLSELSSQELQFLSYKTGKTFFKSVEESEVMRSLINSAIEVEPTDQLDASTKNLSRNLLSNYFKNINHLYSEDEQTPMLTFLYDYFYAAVQTEDSDEFIKRSSWILDNINKSRGQFRKELDKTFHARSEEEKVLQQLIRACHLENGGSNSNFILSLATPSTKLIEDVSDRTGSGVAVGHNFDLTYGLQAIFNLLSEYEVSKLITELDAASLKWKPAEKDLSFLVSFRWHSLLSHQKEINPLYSLATLQADKNLLAKQAQNTHEHKSLKSISGLAQLSLDLGSRKSYLQTLKTIKNNSPDLYLETSAVIGASFADKAPANNGELKDQLKTNSLLLQRISDENMWFVAKNGDQFSEKTNHDLPEVDLKSITFYPDKRTKGGHMIRLVSKNQNSDRTVNLLMDRQGNITFQDVPSLLLPYWLKAEFQHFLLERLNFITSGALSNKLDVPGVKKESVEEDKKKEIVVRRSHYRVLTSTPGRTYSLTSAEARQHADYVLQVYGINIYEENIRRRSAGTLKSNQVITFVKEVEKGVTIPNELTFDPSLYTNN